MKIVTQTSRMSQQFGDKEAIRLLAEIGYDGLDYTMFNKSNLEMLDSPNYEEYAVELRNCADKHNIPFTQAHAPFPTIEFGNDNYNEITRRRIERAIIVSGILGINHVVVHPVTTSENQRQINIDFYNSLVPLCREAGVKIALENMFIWSAASNHALPGACSPSEQFCEYLDELDSDFFVACLDIGHVGLIAPACADGKKETAQDAIRALGKNRLKSLHIHDNDKHTDLHSLPFLHSLDWQQIMKALKEIEYDGDFTLEADNFLMKFPDELLVDASRFMLQVSRYLTGLSFPR